MLGMTIFHILMTLHLFIYSIMDLNKGSKTDKTNYECVCGQYHLSSAINLFGILWLCLNDSRHNHFLTKESLCVFWKMWRNVLLGMTQMRFTWLSRDFSLIFPINQGQHKWLFWEHVLQLMSCSMTPGTITFWQRSLFVYSVKVAQHDFRNDPKEVHVAFYGFVTDIPNQPGAR